MNIKELTRTAVIALIFFGIGAAAAESNLNTFTLRADKVLTDYIGGNAATSEVNITGLIIQAGQVLGYYNNSATDALLEEKANQSDLTGHINNITSNPHNVTLGQVGAANSSHAHGDSDLTSLNWSKLSSVPSYASRWANWSEVTGKPSEFTPEDHGHDASELTEGILPSGRLSGSYTGITGVGTITAGTWQGTAIDDAYIPNTITIDQATTASDVSCTNCLTSTEVASADIAYGVSCTNCLTDTEVASADYATNAGKVDGYDATTTAGATTGVPVISVSTTYSNLKAGYASSAGDANTLDGIDSAAFVKITSGSYTGNDAIGRGIPHGLGRTPKTVTIWCTDIPRKILSLTISNDYMTHISETATGRVLIGLTWDSTNFYVGHVGDKDDSANQSPLVYEWVAMG